MRMKSESNTLKSSDGSKHACPTKFCKHSPRIELDGFEVATTVEEVTLTGP